MNRARIIHEVYRKHREKSGAWGTEDCLTFAAEVAWALTGRDPAAQLRGKYATEAQAKRVMSRHKWRTMGDVAASMYDPVPLAQARTGDWAWVPKTDTLGVVVGDRVACRAIEGIFTVPIEEAERAYRVE